MRYSFRLLLIVSLFAAMSLCVYLFRFQPVRSANASVDEPTIDLGWLPVDEQHTFSVRVQNSGDEALRVVGVQGEL
jgi:hypothetical protein